MCRATVNLSGQKFGRWFVVKKVENIKGLVAYLCRCDCGVEKIITRVSFVYGASKSCGCLRRELAKKRRTKHNKAKTKIYKAWQNMLRRCCDKSVTCYHNYGGRGIKVCDRWLESFENFYEDMGEVPKEKSLDRVNNDGDYCKENCRWATREEQGNNKRNNKYFSFKGETKSLKKWSEDIKIPVNNLKNRLNKGWSIEKTLTTPLRFSLALKRS